MTGYGWRHQRSIVVLRLAEKRTSDKIPTARPGDPVMPSPDINRGEPTSPAPVRRYSIDSIVHAVRLLNELTSGTTLTLAEASRIVGASRSTAYRVLVTLEGEDLVERLPEGGYRAGRRLIAWATRLLS